MTWINFKGEKEIDEHSESKEQGKNQKRNNSHRVLERLHLGHLAILHLVDRVEEEDHPRLVPFHLLHRADEGLALTVCQVLGCITMIRK